MPNVCNFQLLANCCFCKYRISNATKPINPLTISRTICLINLEINPNVNPTLCTYTCSTFGQIKYLLFNSIVEYAKVLDKCRKIILWPNSQPLLHHSFHWCTTLIRVRHSKFPVGEIDFSCPSIDKNKNNIVLAIKGE